jgi:hypothetical protein
MEKNNDVEVCSVCSGYVNEKVKQFSKAKFGKILCFNCQKEDGTKPYIPPKPEDITEKVVQPDRDLPALTSQELLSLMDISAHLYKILLKEYEEDAKKRATLNYEMVLDKSIGIFNTRINRKN